MFKIYQLIRQRGRLTFDSLLQLKLMLWKHQKCSIISYPKHLKENYASHKLKNLNYYRMEKFSFNIISTFHFAFKTSIERKIK